MKPVPGDGGGRAQIRKTRFGEIAAGLQLGGAYAFDEAAYNRFRPLAEGEGVSLPSQDSSGPDPSPTGVRLMHIQAADLARCKPGGTTPKGRWWHRRRWIGGSEQALKGYRGKVDVDVDLDALRKRG